MPDTLGTVILALLVNVGITFTLPYPDQKSLRRCLNERSDVIDSYKAGCIYNYKVPNSGFEIPDKFELNMENGIFYLSRSLPNILIFRVPLYSNFNS